MRAQYRDRMTKYLISFPAAAMTVSATELPSVDAAAHAVVREAKDAGVWVFGGGIDERVRPVRVDGAAEVSAETSPPTARLDGGFTVLELPTADAARMWAAKFAVACRCPQEVRAFMDDPES